MMLQQAREKIPHLVLLNALAIDECSLTFAYLMLTCLFEAVQQLDLVSYQEGLVIFL
jgi:hypothetical protein